MNMGCEERERGSTFCEDISGVERDAVGLCCGGVEGALHVIDGLRNEVEAEEAVCVKVVE
jgi:hypothetical protein